MPVAIAIHPRRDWLLPAPAGILPEAPSWLEEV
jgi:hypothetical protein